MISLKFVPKWPTKRITSWTICFILTCFVIHVWIMRDVLRFVDNISSFFSAYKNKPDGIKYVLTWNKYYLIPTVTNENILSKLGCPINNCIFTADKNLLHGDYSQFDAIIFDEELKNKELKPAKRSSSQLYVFTTVESSYTQPVCEVHSEGFFNWTFTYRLDSDVPWLYFAVMNSTGSIVAPNVTVKWHTSLEPIKLEVKSILAKKKKAAAWLVSHCRADSFRDEYLTRLQEHLSHYGLKIDVYGQCTGNQCPNSCEEMIKNDYRFYMAFENSFAEDYVTEKVLHAYDNYAVPIVYGGANYSRFLPPGSYINAREIHPYNLAFIIHEAINDPDTYERYFRWTNLYRVTGNPMTYHPLCSFCEALNNEKAKHAPPKKDFRIWWNGQNGMKWCLPEEYWNETSKVNIDAKHIFKLY